MNENDKIKDLEFRAKNTKYLMDRLSRAYTGFTIEELIRMSLERKEQESNGDDA